MSADGKIWVPGTSLYLDVDTEELWLSPIESEELLFEIHTQ